MKSFVGAYEIAGFLRATSPRAKKFYDPISQRLEEEIRPHIQTHGLKKISESIEELDYVRFERNALWIRADSSIYLKIPLRTKGDGMKSTFYIPCMFLFEVLGQGFRRKVLVPVAGLSNDKFNEYQKNILNRIHELADHVGRLYAT